jgi:hypothetical protein
MNSPVVGPTIYQYSKDTTWSGVCTIQDSTHINSMTVFGSSILAAKTGIGNVNGLFLSNNSGSTWTKILPNYGYAVVNSGDGICAGMSDGLYLSQNGGSSFTKYLSLNNVGSVSMDYSGTNIFAGVSGFLTESQGGVYRSVDNGLNWKQVGLNSITFNSLLNTGTYLYASSDSNGVYKSSDGGNTWTGTTMGSPWFAYSLTPAGGANILIGTRQGGGGIYKMVNNGSGQAPFGPGGKIYVVATRDTNIFAGKFADGIYRTTNN